MVYNAPISMDAYWHSRGEAFNVHGSCLLHTRLLYWCSQGRSQSTPGTTGMTKLPIS